MVILQLQFKVSRALYSLILDCHVDFVYSNLLLAFFYHVGSLSIGIGFISGFFTALLLAVLVNVVGIIVWRKFKGKILN